MHSYDRIRKHFSHLSVMLLIDLCFLLSVCVSCGPPQKDPAVETFEGWILAVRMGDSKKVWDTLSQRTQDHFLKLYPHDVRQIHDTTSSKSLSHTSLPSATPQTTQAHLNTKQKQEHQLKHLASKDQASIKKQDLSSYLSIQLDWSFESPFAQTVKLKKVQPSVRSVEYFYAQKKWEIPLVKEKGTWRIHLHAAQAL